MIRFFSLRLIPMIAGPLKANCIIDLMPAQAIGIKMPGSS